MTNSYPRAQELVLYNQRPFVNHIDVFVEAEHGFEFRRNLGYFSDQRNQHQASQFGHLLLSVEPGQTYTLLTRLETRGAIETDWRVASPADYSREQVIELFKWGLYFGLLAALAIYSLMSGLMMRRGSILFYLGYCFCAFGFMMGYSGVARIISLGIPAPIWFYSNWLMGLGSILFLLLLCIYFLETRRTMPTMDKCIKLMAILTSLAILLFVAAPWYPWIYASQNIIMQPLLLLSYAGLVAAGVLAVRRGVSGGWFFLMGQVLFIVLLAGIIFLAQYGLISNLKLVFWSIPVGQTLLVTMLSLAIAKQARDQHREHEMQRQLLVEQSRFASVGRSVGMVAHQWRSPLARIGALVSELEVYQEAKGESTSHDQRINQVLEYMHQCLATMGGTIEDFRSFYSANTNCEAFFPHTMIKHVLAILHERLLQQGVDVHYTFPDKPCQVVSHPTALVHATMVLMENALDTFQLRRVDEPRIQVTLRCANGRVALSVADNGGGIASHLQGKIFEPSVSGKTDGMGIGLYIARMLVQERLKGTISVENRDGGACFHIEFPASPSDEG
ncbi:sensor histidine kinase [Desulfurispirillum indicum]|uniref:sensor histidine kinase n=1 Tax=Desulfurispirillum indicum TaxID=936456 RepID=UPI001CFB1E8C|nr:sensor histidine kinase [Desulfurispirillum indicum]UCZ58030.1 sensor histidine kinase [Desulfurispirillum indicum]